MKHLNKNNKGFSLVELLISVAILAVVALPLLQVFTLSAKLTGKARASGEATAAAQNIQETIEARGVANILNQNTDGTYFMSKSLRDISVTNGLVSFRFTIDSSTGIKELEVEGEPRELYRIGPIIILRYPNGAIRKVVRPKA